MKNIILIFFLIAAGLALQASNISPVTPVISSKNKNSKSLHRNKGAFDCSLSSAREKLAAEYFTPLNGNSTLQEKQDIKLNQSCEPIKPRKKSFTDWVKSLFSHSENERYNVPEEKSYPTVKTAFDCVKESVKKRWGNQSYVCTGNKPVLILDARQCVNDKRVVESYAGTMANQFLEATKCTGLNNMEMVPILNHESGFKHNAVSFTGAGGAGQLTAEAINEVNKGLFEHKKMHINDFLPGKNPQCLKLKDQISKNRSSKSAASGVFSSSDSKRCSRINNKNVFNNFIYSSLIHLQNRKVYFDSVVVKNLSSENKLKIQSLLSNPKEYEKVNLTISSLMYNSGGPAALALLEEFLDGINKKQLPSARHFQNSFYNFMNDRKTVLEKNMASLEIKRKKEKINCKTKRTARLCRDLHEERRKLEVNNYLLRVKKDALESMPKQCYSLSG